MLGGGDKKSGCQKSDKAVIPVDTKKELAKIAGVSHDTYSKAKTRSTRSGLFAFSMETPSNKAFYGYFA